MKSYYTLFCFLMLVTSCEEIIEVEDISQEQVSVLAPTNNTIIENSQIQFSWQSLEFAETYQLQVATPNFTEAVQIAEDTIVSTTEFNTTLETGNYEWRIKALNSAYQTEFTTQNFSVDE